MQSETEFDVDGRLLVFGGPYSNLQATEALLAEARRLGLGPDRLLCTGDLVAYCAEPQATVDLIRETGCPVVQGNCEESLGADAEDCGCGFEEATLCDLLSQQWYSYSRGRVSDETKRWMAGLPRRLTVRIGGRRLLAIHGGVAQINRFIFPRSPAAEKATELDTAGTDGILAGHSGIPFVEMVGDRLWLNSGALGMPANDGTPRVWYALLEASGDRLQVSAESARLRPRDGRKTDARGRLGQRLRHLPYGRPVAQPRRPDIGRPGRHREAFGRAPPALVTAPSGVVTTTRRHRAFACRAEPASICCTAS